MFKNKILTNYMVNGYKVCIVKGHNKVSLSTCVDVSNDFRKEFNEWLGSFFGYENVIEDGQTIIDSVHNIIYVNETGYNYLLSEELSKL